MIVQIAWRNVWRNRTRSLVVICAIAVGLWGGIFSYAFMIGMGNQQIYSVIHTETGHLQLNEPGYLVNHDLQTNIREGESLEKKVAGLADVEAVCAFIESPAIASTATASSGVMVNGADPKSFQKFSELYHTIIDGSYFTTDMHNPIIIGDKLANKLHAKVHSRIVFTMQTYTGEISYFAFKVEGIFRLHNTEFNEQMVFVRKEDLRKALGFPPNSISALNVLLKNDNQTNAVQTTLKKTYPKLEIQTWKELSPMIDIMSGTMNQMAIIFVFIILLALAFGIINTMLMAVMDRTRELGMLMCIGMNQRKIFLMIVLETTFLSLTGALFGLLLGLITITWLGATGIDLSFLSEGINAFGFSSHIYPRLDLVFYPEFAIMVIFIALFSSVFPARRAIKLNPSEAVRAD